MSTAPLLIVHGGAGAACSPERARELSAFLSELARRGRQALLDGATAVDVVVDAVVALEDDPRFNAGLGARLQADGGARLSASLMDGVRHRFSGVVGIAGIANPARFCHALQDDDDRVLMGEGALARARELGLEERDNRTPERIDQHERGKSGLMGTVGAVALDASGRLAACTSTGGRGGERVGRVSDVCTVAGNFASDVAGVSCTGVGEEINEQGLAVRIATLIDAGSALVDAAELALAQMQAQGCRAGFIALDASGNWAARHSTPAMHWAVADTDGEVHHGA